MLRPSYSPAKEFPLRTEYEAGWVPGQVWTFGIIEKSRTSAGLRTLDRPSRSLVTILSEISRQLPPHVQTQLTERYLPVRHSALFIWDLN